MTALYLEGIVAVGNIGHGYYALGVHLVHGGLEGGYLVFQGGGVPQLVNLVYKARHARSLAEHSLHIGELHMAVGVHHAGAQGAFHDRFSFFTEPGAKYYAFIVHFHKGILQREGRG